MKSNIHITKRSVVTLLIQAGSRGSWENGDLEDDSEAR